MKNPLFPWPLRCGLIFWWLARHAVLAVPESPPAPPTTGREWEQEQNLSFHKEAPRATLASFGDLASALKILPEHSTFWRSLDGLWKFHWVKRPEERPVNFFKLEYDVSGWKDIAVPSSWRCQGYDVPVYSRCSPTVP